MNFSRTWIICQQWIFPAVRFCQGVVRVRLARTNQPVIIRITALCATNAVITKISGPPLHRSGGSSRARPLENTACAINNTGSTVIARPPEGLAAEITNPRATPVNAVRASKTVYRTTSPVSPLKTRMIASSRNFTGNFHPRPIMHISGERKLISPMLVTRAVYEQRLASKSVTCIRILFRILAVLLALLPVVANSVCKKNEPHWLWNYDGSIADQYRVKMTLVFDGSDVHSDVHGVYFYATQLKDIQINGRISGGTDIVLDELDPAGKVVARFEGRFAEHDPRGKFGSDKLQCEIIVGSWHNLDSPERLPVYLSLEGGTSGLLTNRYAPAGVQDDNLIHWNALQFWNAVKSADKATVASLIAYPINVGISGGTKRLNSLKELIANYDAVFSTRYREAIANAVPRNMFVRDQGVMLGNGEVWFGPDGKVKALNNF